MRPQHLHGGSFSAGRQGVVRTRRFHDKSFGVGREGVVIWDKYVPACPREKVPYDFNVVVVGSSGLTFGTRASCNGGQQG